MAEEAPPPEYSSLSRHTVLYHRLDGLELDATTLQFNLGNFSFVGMFEIEQFQASFTVRIQLSHAIGEFPKPVRCMITLLDASGTDPVPYKHLLLQDKTYTSVEGCAIGVNGAVFVKSKEVKHLGFKKGFKTKNISTRSLVFKFEVMWV